MNVESELLRLLNQVRRNRGLPELPELAPAAELRRHGGLDSIDLAELTVRIEDRFGFDVFAAGVVREWGELCARVRQHVENRG